MALLRTLWTSPECFDLQSQWEQEGRPRSASDSLEVDEGWQRGGLCCFEMTMCARVKLPHLSDIVCPLLPQTSVCVAVEVIL